MHVKCIPLLASTRGCNRFVIKCVSLFKTSTTYAYDIFFGMQLKRGIIQCIFARRQIIYVYWVKITTFLECCLSD